MARAAIVDDGALGDDDVTAEFFEQPLGELAGDPAAIGAIMAAMAALVLRGSDPFYGLPAGGNGHGGGLGCGGKSTGARQVLWFLASRLRQSFLSQHCACPAASGTVTNTRIPVTIREKL